MTSSLSSSRANRRTSFRNAACSSFHAKSKVVFLLVVNLAQEPLSFVILSFVIPIRYADTDAGERSAAVFAATSSGTGAGFGVEDADDAADADDDAGTATTAAVFSTNRCGRPPGSLMRAGTPITIMLE